MKTVLTTADRESLMHRLDALTSSSSPQWGRMNVGEMVCHLGDQLKVALGEVKTPDHSTFVGRQIMRRLVLMGLPVPKGKIETFAEIDQAKGRGTRPEELDADRQAVKGLLSTFLATESGFQDHGFFGPLSKAQWARLVYIHMDHHLSQFGV